MKAKPIPMRLALADLEPDPRNPNIVAPEILEKIAANIKRTGMYPPIIVRPAVKGKVEPPWIIVDGHHRKMVLGNLGNTEAECVVFDVTDREAGVLLLTLNRLHGEDDYNKRAALVSDLAEFTPIEQLPQILPETLPELEDLLRIRQIDLEALEREQRETADRQESEAPRAFTVLLYGEQEAVIRQALESVKHEAGIAEGAKNADGNALELLAADWLAGHGLAPAQAPDAA